MKNPDLRSQAVMNVDKGETIAGMWATPKIPEIGVYKLAVKKRKDGTFEWVHFQHRLDNTRKVLFRGEVESMDRVADVLGALTGQRAKKGIFIATSDFSSDALDYVSRVDTKIVLIDGETLAELMIDHNVGVSTIATYDLKKIDSDYFTEE